MRATEAALRRAALVVVGGLSLAACSSPSAVGGARGAPVDERPAAPAGSFGAAREALLAGRAEEAVESFSILRRDPELAMEAALWMQEAQREAARARGAAGDGGGWWFEARQRGTTQAWLLAARVAPDPAAEAEALQGARAAAGASPADGAWLAYAMATGAARAGELDEARAQCDLARKLDPRHARAAWLDAWLVARQDTPARGAEALRRWLLSARGSLLVEPARVAEAELDLAILALSSERTDEAASLLADLDAWRVDLARLQAARAALHESVDDPQAAMAAAQAASVADPSDLLPLVQQAILCEGPLGDPAKAEALWRTIHERSDASRELLDVLRALRARVRWERLEAQRLGRGG
jgi:hypothetical protein